MHSVRYTAYAALLHLAPVFSSDERLPQQCEHPGHVAETRR